MGRPARSDLHWPHIAVGRRLTPTAHRASSACADASTPRAGQPLARSMLLLLMAIVIPGGPAAAYDHCRR